MLAKRSMHKALSGIPSPTEQRGTLVFIEVENCLDEDLWETNSMEGKGVLGQSLWPGSLGLMGSKQENIAFCDARDNYQTSCHPFSQTSWQGRRSQLGKRKPVPSMS